MTKMKTVERRECYLKAVPYSRGNMATFFLPESREHTFGYVTAFSSKLRKTYSFSNA